MAKNTKIFVLYSAFSTKKEATAVARTLLEKRLIACANIYDNVSSLYRWQGKIAQEKEAVMVAKTTKTKLAAATAAIKKLHSYMLPCVVAYPITDGNPAFLQWVADETVG